jgi:cation:H+ antiporter
LFVVGVGLLIGGAELLVRGSSRLATAMGISQLTVGLTVVAFGTGSPELAVTLRSSLTGQGDLALGNVIGSNISNVLLVLGISAVLGPVAVSRQMVRESVPIMILVSAALFGLSADGDLSRNDGLILIAAGVGYIIFSLLRSQGRTDEKNDASDRGRRVMARSSAMALLGLVILVIGANFVVKAGVAAAHYLGIDELVIGLTIVAVGTSLPEIATSVMAAMRGERDIAVGNAVGSNIFNILFVLGVAAVVSGVDVPEAVYRFDLPVMTVVAVACLPVFFTGFAIARWEGLMFLAYFACYTTYLILKATDHTALAPFSGVMLIFVFPLTLATLAVFTFQAIRDRRSGAKADEDAGPEKNPASTAGTNGDSDGE